MDMMMMMMMMILAFINTMYTEANIVSFFWVLLVFNNTMYSEANVGSFSVPFKPSTIQCIQMLI